MHSMLFNTFPEKDYCNNTETNRIKPLSSHIHLKISARFFLIFISEEIMLSLMKFCEILRI